MRQGIKSLAGVLLFKRYGGLAGVCWEGKRVAVSDGTAVGASLVGLPLGFFKRMSSWIFIKLHQAYLKEPKARDLHLKPFRCFLAPNYFMGCLGLLFLMGLQLVSADQYGDPSPIFLSFNPAVLIYQLILIANSH